MDKSILFTKVNTAEFVDSEMRPVGDYQIKVKTSYSTISNGTEKANITGSDTVGWMTGPTEAVFPRHLGYSTSGTVVEKGKCVTDFEIGDEVAMCWTQHRLYNVIDAKNAVKLTYKNVTLAEASIAHISVFPLAALRKTRLEAGESVLVMGQGILGLLAVVLARAMGAYPVIAVDPVAERREKALKHGADFAFNPFDEDFAQKVKNVTGGGAKVCVEVTGVGAGLNGALDCMARFGRVALLGCTRVSDFTIDYYRKVHGPGITLIGAHTMARPDDNSYPGYFTTIDDMKTVLNLCEGGRISLKALVDEVHSPEECTEVYSRLVNDKNFPSVVQFDWTKISE